MEIYQEIQDKFVRAQFEEMDKEFNHRMAEIKTKIDAIIDFIREVSPK